MADDASNLPAPADNAGLRALAANVNVNGQGLAPKSLAELMDFGQLMAKAGPMVGKAFRGNPGACVAVTMQAMRWGMDPFAVSQKAYVTTDKFGNEHMGYEAQLINAVILSRAPLARAPEYTFSGTGAKRRCKVAIYLRGEKAPLEYETPETMPDGNSPLWKKDLDQQLSYYAIRAWARRHKPELIMGVYTPDELQDGQVIDVTPAPVVHIADRDEAPLEDTRPPAYEGEFLRGAAAKKIVDDLVARFDAASNDGQIAEIWAECERYKGKISNNRLSYLEEMRDRAEERVAEANQIDNLPEGHVLRERTPAPVAEPNTAAFDKALEELKACKTKADLSAWSAIDLSQFTDEQRAELRSWYVTITAAIKSEVA